MLARIVNRAGGYDKLVASFPTVVEPVGERFDRQTVEFGFVRWKSCTTVIVSDDGLYVQARPPLISVQPAMLIPWQEIASVRPAKLYQRSSMLLTVGNPSISTVGVMAPVFAAMQPLLPGSAHEAE